MMMLSERLRCYADECVAQARSMADEEKRVMLLENADAWLRLAQISEAVDEDTREEPQRAA